MQVVKKGFIVFIVIWIAIVVLMPKKEFYYKLEEELVKHEIKLNEAKVSEGLFSLGLEKVTYILRA